MTDYLLIRGGDGERILDALAVAVDLSTNANIQIDIAVPAALVPIAQLSEVVRRVIPITAPTPPKFSEAVSKGDWKNKLIAATKTVASAANRNMRDYLAVAEKLRLVRYAAVYDFDASGFSLAVARAAKTQKIIGFAPECAPNAVSGAALMYHDTRLVPQKLSEVERCRYLVARHLNYPPDLPIGWKLRTTVPPTWMPKTPFIDVLTAAGITVVGDFEKADVCAPEPLSPEILAALSSAATVVVGNGLLTSIAIAKGTKTLYIGAAKALPYRATLIDTPTALNEALKKCATPSAASRPVDTPPTPPVSVSDSGLHLKK
jgi:hypothetical protein